MSETGNERDRIERDEKRNREMTKLLATVVAEQRQDRQREGQRGPRLERNQCAYCKERGHWARECPKKQRRTFQRPKPRSQTSDLLSLED